MEYLLIPVVLFLGFGNGANDNFKGFATVWGSDALSYRKALLLATITTIAGSLLSLTLAGDLVQQFSGKDLLPSAIVNAPQFIVSVGIGAALTVIIATCVGLPVSTTHALIGGLIGAGWAASTGDIQYATLWHTFLQPLLFSPIAAALLGLLAYRLLRLWRVKNDCACVIPSPSSLATQNGVVLSVAAPKLLIAEDAICDTITQPTLRFSIPSMLNRLHTFSASLICFARAVNDTPKLAALLIAGHMLFDCVNRRCDGTRRYHVFTARRRNDEPPHQLHESHARRRRQSTI